MQDVWQQTDLITFNISYDDDTFFNEKFVNKKWYHNVVFLCKLFQQEKMLISVSAIKIIEVEQLPSAL